MEASRATSQSKQNKPIEQKKPSEPKLTGDKPTADQGQGNGDGKTKKVYKSKFNRKSKAGKIHIRLPSIEAYQKEIEFAAEAPGRVVVRLERLMGSDKIRPVDGKYMETLIHRLEEEETMVWERKIRLRKKAENERYRQLAIAGFMEPGPGMEDLFNHPVFRVNRILNRLSKLDNTFAANAVLKLPPIIQVDPFEDDDTGAAFKEFPAHRLMSKECHPKEEEQRTSEELGEDEVPLTKSYADYVAEAAAAEAAQEADAAAEQQEEEEEDEDEYDEELVEDNLPRADRKTPAEVEPIELNEMEEISHQLDLEYMASLTTLQNKYGVPKSEKFEELWKPFCCELVEKVYSDYEDFDQMYDVAMDILDVYIRQGMVTEEHLSKAMRGQIPSYAKSVTQHAEEEGQAEAEEGEEGG